MIHPTVFESELEIALKPIREDMARLEEKIDGMIEMLGHAVVEVIPDA